MAKKKPIKKKQATKPKTAELRIDQAGVVNGVLFFQGSVDGGELVRFRVSCDELRDLAGSIATAADYQDGQEVSPARQVAKLLTVESTPPRTGKVRCRPITDLTAIVPPPAKPVETGNPKLWAHLEKQIGPVPQDYKDYITLYGTGSLGGFVRVYNPFAHDEYADLMRAILRFYEVNSQLKQLDGYHFPYPIYPEPAGIVPWASDDNGNVYYWQTGGDPDHWTVVVQASRSPRWQEVRSSMTAFLVDAFTQRVKCRFWPSDFPDSSRPDTFQFKQFKRRRKN